MTESRIKRFEQLAAEENWFRLLTEIPAYKEGQISQLPDTRGKQHQLGIEHSISRASNLLQMARKGSEVEVNENGGFRLFFDPNKRR